MIENKERLIATLIFLAVIGLLIGDLLEDLEAGSSMGHVLQEAIVVFLGLGGILTLWFKFFTTRESLKRASIDLTKVRNDLNHYKSETKSLSQGLAEKIDAQLKSWNLTNAEKEVSLLILKGLSNKEIADVRGAAEKTVRHQASSIYQKSNLSGRAELSAFFLEDLLVIRN